MNILLSVIIPVYNTARFLEQCIDSVLKQNVKPMEVILVDDGSTDASPDLCDRLALLDKRITVIHQRNSGLSSARNRALEICRGKYITFVDSDDVLLENTYLPNLEILERDETITAVQFPYVYPYNQPSPRQGADKKAFWKGEGEILRGYMSPDINHAVWNKIFRRSVFSRLRFPYGRMFEDSYIVPDLAKNIAFMYSSGLGGYGYNLQPQSLMTSEMTPEKLQDRSVAYMRILQAASCYPSLRRSSLFVKYYHFCILLSISIRKWMKKNESTPSPAYANAFRQFQSHSFSFTALLSDTTITAKEKIRLLIIKITGVPFYLSHLIRHSHE